jgi:hypothetical protein
MRTRAWAMKAVNTQMASWTQLRHANVLQVKESYTAASACEYPAAYVEPLPHVWGAIEGMARHAAEVIERACCPDRSLARKPVDAWMREPLEKASPEKQLEMLESGGWLVNPRSTQQRQVAFFRNFADTAAVLKGIAAKQPAREALSQAETKFLRDVIQVDNSSGGPYYDGWYPKLFYREAKACGRAEPLICDVHTDPPDRLVGDPGAVLHEAVGTADLLLLAVDSGAGPVLYAGPVLSHYEFETTGLTRKGDGDWQQDVLMGELPPRPSWTKAYLIEGGRPRGYVDLGD